MIFGVKKEEVPAKKKRRKKVSSADKVANAIKADSKKKFSSPEEVTAYYKSEGNKVKEALRDFKIKQGELQLQLAREEYLKISSQKADLDDLKKDLIQHRKEVEAKIKYLQGKKEDASVHKKSVDAFVKKMKVLEKESKQIMDTREELIKHQNQLVYKMKDLAKQSNVKFKATDVPTSEDLFKFQASKGEVLAKAKALLSEEMKAMFSDSYILEGVDNKTTKKIQGLNVKVINAQNDKKDTLKKLELLEISQEKAAKEMARAEKKVKKLEGLYKKLLKK